jgi:hypothetical protein
MHQWEPGIQFPYCAELEHIAAHSQSEFEEPFFHPDRFDTNPPINCTDKYSLLSNFSKHFD